MYKINNYSQWVRNTSLQACTEQVEVERPGEVSVFSFIGGGYCNIISDACNASVVGGYLNQILSGSDCSFIGGGANNTISTTACYAVVGGGGTNSIYNSSFTGVLSGCNNAIGTHSNYSVIAGGRHNSFVDNTGSYQSNSFIAGGAYNTISSPYSSILGGSGNTIGVGFQYAGVFGQNVNAVASNTFHVECLNAVNTPISTVASSFPIGTIFVCNAPYSGTGTPHPLYIIL